MRQLGQLQFLKIISSFLLLSLFVFLPEASRCQRFPEDIVSHLKAGQLKEARASLDDFRSSEPDDPRGLYYAGCFEPNGELSADLLKKSLSRRRPNQKPRPRQRSPKKAKKQRPKMKDSSKRFKKCLEAIKPHLVKGSVLGFDEVNHPDAPGETLALNEIFGLNNIKLKRFPYASRVSYFVVE